ncbi:uncharacterized protein LOC110247846 [Exaiptasia diaphana]|uniref:BHLH domain-containing protein n=1 Tax=Exaiptasia diaphana TaxID=2652724 RepID=A0A913YU42_EXADI|nr:uncharacterized protein LOC110247846 [Exaiptasia diaphana]
MEDDCSLPGGPDFGLLCTENREFLYNGDGITTPASLTTSDSMQAFEEDDESNMATSFGGSSLAESVSSKVSCSSVLSDGEKRKKVRKRDSKRDRERSAAEQGAYKKLREVVPTLNAIKKPTKLQTIRHTLKFIECLQDKLNDLEGEKLGEGDSTETNTNENGKNK